MTDEESRITQGAKIQHRVEARHVKAWWWTVLSFPLWHFPASVINRLIGSPVPEGGGIWVFTFFVWLVGMAVVPWVYAARPNRDEAPERP